MAIDTAAKRYSATMLGMPFRGTGAFPTGTIGAASRAAIAYLYGGIALDVPAATVAGSRTRVRFLPTTRIRAIPTTRIRSTP